ncbi:U6 small nuclear RNA (adenine-(43)-N(6))-methyltransferase-like protein [Drosera capensis]
MPSEKRKRNPPHATAATIHPRNKYANNPPNFSLLASPYPSFAHYVLQCRDGRPKIDWTDFGATHVTDVALDWAHKNVSSNLHISALIESRKVDNLGIACDNIRTGSNGIVLEEKSQSNRILSGATEAANIMNSSVTSPESKWEDRMFFKGESKADLDQVVDGETEPNLSTETISDSDLNTNYSGPPILFGVVKKGEV